jgi:hypothetical protein
MLRGEMMGLCRRFSFINPKPRPSLEATCLDNSCDKDCTSPSNPKKATMSCGLGAKTCRGAMLTICLFMKKNCVPDVSTPSNLEMMQHKPRAHMISTGKPLIHRQCRTVFSCHDPWMFDVRFQSAGAKSFCWIQVCLLVALPRNSNRCCWNG